MLAFIYSALVYFIMLEIVQITVLNDKPCHNLKKYSNICLETQEFFSTKSR